MTPDDFTLICRIVRAKTGYVVDPAKAPTIENRLTALVRQEGHQNLAELMGAIKTQRTDRAIWGLADAMLPKDTSFFRDRTPFDQFRDIIVPDLQARSPSSPLRIWSAGCGTGEEAYSLAMILEANLIGQEGRAVEIVGSDLSQRCLERARSGIYSHIEVQRGLPIRDLVNHFERQGEAWLISADLRDRVQWSRINLLSDFSSVGQFDVIFCRYVLCGLDDITRRGVLSQLAKGLNEGGYLVVGRDEAVLDHEVGLSPVWGLPDIYRREPDGPRSRSE
jgi:chemotaxis protein methyltransferase CheR